MSVLVDTPIWSLALRRQTEDLSRADHLMVGELSTLVREGHVHLIGPIRQEVLSGIRNARTFERVRERLASFEDDALTTDDFTNAAKLYNTCRAKGITGSAVDLLICAAAIRLNLAVFTTDKDFSQYARHIPLRLHSTDETRL